MKKQNSIIYSGPSLIDGKPIVAILVHGSSNRKTGKGMAQVYIIRSDISPLDASKSGEDYSICGNCPHRGVPTDNPAKSQAENRSCYVLLFQGPRQVYKAYKAGKYPEALDHQSIIDQGSDEFIRLGSYGDSAAVPLWVIGALLSRSLGHTSYTHQSNIKHIKTDYQRSMISADNKKQAMGHHLNKHRTFRVIPISTWQAKGKAELLKNEILCPASNESTAKDVTCVQCGLCNGSRSKAKSIAIVAHGASKAKVKG